jgi:2-polyprenyl-3-methyl-5-hydroxy-6-metoxy-1,4-benzoquinol methylase
MTEKPTYREMLDEFLPDPSSPLYQMNLDYALNAIERGDIIAEIMEEHIPISGGKVLDLGCGEGGVAIAFALRGASVTALDVSPGRIERMGVWAKEHDVDVDGVVASALETGLASSQYDIVICNDFMEHVTQPQLLAYEVERLLKDGGYFYLSVQNRLSLTGVISDPHTSLFGLTWMPRWLAKIYAVRIRRRTKSYSVFVIPTNRFLNRIFNNTTVKLSSIISKSATEQISNPQNIESKYRRIILLTVKRLRLTWLVLRLLDSKFNQFFLGMLTYVGQKQEHRNN